MNENKMLLVDAEKVAELNEKAREMMSHLSTYFVGLHYRYCLEELGLWENEDEHKK